MKIKKIKSDGAYVYPATIAAAVKDANFLTEENSPMTLGEINLYFNSVMELFEEDKQNAFKVVANPDSTITIEPYKYYVWNTVSTLNLSLEKDDNNYEISEVYSPVTTAVLATNWNYSYSTVYETSGGGPSGQNTYNIGIKTYVSNDYDSLAVLKTSDVTWQNGKIYHLHMWAKASFAWEGITIDMSTINASDKANATISSQAFSAGGVSFGTVTVGGVSLDSTFGLLTGTTWMYRTAQKALYSSNSGNRSFGINNCKKGYLITLNVSNLPTATNAELVSEDGNTKIFKVLTDGPVAFSIARYSYIYSIKITQGEITCNCVIHSDSGSQVGTADPITIGADWKEYDIDINGVNNGKALAIYLNANKKQPNGTGEAVDNITYSFADVSFETTVSTYSPKDGITIPIYMFQFSSPSAQATQLTLPGDLKWNSAPNIASGKTYQCIIINDLATLKEFN